MKVGMIFECGPKGADKKVCERLVRMIDPKIQVVGMTLDNEPKLVAGCGRAAAKLLQEGCERVIIIWDLYPAWRERGQKPCLKEDREAIFRSLKEAGVTSPPVHLVCIQEELEAWLLADGRAISAVLSTRSRPVSIKHRKNTERLSNPKKELDRIFREHAKRPYSDRYHAHKIVEALPDLKKIRRCASFNRFAIKVTGKEA